MKTAIEHAITEQEHAALIVVRDMLRAQAAASKALEARDPQYGRTYSGSHTIDGHGLFNMATCMSLNNDDVFSEEDRKSFHCGTIGCIGGWAYLVMKESFDPTTHVGAVKLTYDQGDAAFRYVNNVAEGPHPLRPLYYPAVVYGPDWYKITPAQAADAIDNFLHKGTPGWREVLGDTVSFVDDDGNPIDA